MEKTLKSVKECLRKNSYNIYSTSTSKDDILSQAIVFDAFHIEQFLIENNKVLFSNVGGKSKEVLQTEIDEGLRIMNSCHVSNDTDELVENTPGSNPKDAEDNQEAQQEYTPKDDNLEFI